MPQLFANFAATTLASQALAGDTSLSVVSSAGFPIPAADEYFYAVLATASVPETAWEVVKVTALSGNTLTATRAQDGTTAQAWPIGSKLELRPVAQALRDLGAGGGGMLAQLAAAEISITDAATATAGRWHKCSGTTADYTLTLPAAAGCSGKYIGVRMDAGLTKLVTVKGNASELIDGQNTRIMWANESAVLVSDGSSWAKVAGKTIPMSAKLLMGAQNDLVGNYTRNKILLGTLAYDNGGMVTLASNQFTIRRPGMYTAKGMIQLDGSSSSFTGTLARLLISLGINNGSVSYALFTEVNSIVSGGYASPNFVLDVQPTGAWTLWLDVQTSHTANTVDIASANLAILEVPSW